MPWKQLSSKEMYRNHWMWITEDQVETETGKLLTYGVVHKHPFALIIPWDGERLTVVGQYRYTVDCFSWEFPSGHFEHTDIQETAQEELREEAGLLAKEIKEVGSFWVATGCFDQECKVFLATGLTSTEHHLEAGEEGMQCKAVTLQEFWQMVADGSLHDGPSLAAMALAQNMLKIF